MHSRKEIMALKVEKKQLILYLLQQGQSIGKISEMTGVSESTIKRIKKEIVPDLNKGTISSTTKPLTYLEYSLNDLKIQAKLAKEKILFEDTEEGWVFGSSVSKENSRLNQFSKWWSAIVYPESAPENWKELLRARGYEIAISPLHDKDKWEHDSPEREVTCEDGTILHIPKGALYKKGDRKKPHWHIIVKTESRCSFNEMNKELQDLLGCPRIQKCRSLKGAYEYFIHLNHPDRYHYDRDEIETYNGFTLEPTQREREEILQDIIRTIQTEEIDDFSKLTLRYLDEVEYLNVISIKAYALGKLLDVIWKKHNPDYVKPIKIVE